MSGLALAAPAFDQSLPIAEPRADPALAQVPPHASSVLAVDLDALRLNYRALKTISGRAECAAVLKADAYGLGLEAVMRALLGEGARVFFVATIDEAWRARQVSADALVFVLNGLYPGAAPAFVDLAAIPVLGSRPEVEEWATFCAANGQRWPAALHVDTGMNRLGLPPAEAHALASTGALAAFDIALLMSHLACADQPGSPMNAQQRQVFEQVRAVLPPAMASLANSAGTLIGPAYHYDLVRPGIALYGGAALAGVANPMKPVVRLLGRILQVRDIAPGQSVGYGRTFVAERPCRIATVACGYADGFPRAATQGTVAIAPGMAPALALEAKPGIGPRVGVAGFGVPIVGRVSMDLLALDVTDVPPQAVQRGAFAELIGPQAPLDLLAAASDTIAYEVLVRLGRRCHRVYVGS